MSRLAIKMCGLSTPETVGAAVRAGATHLGFVHFPKSPRHVEPEQIRALTGAVPSHVDRVAVLVDPDDDQIARLVATGALTALQLHGGESPERVAAVRRLSGLPVWKAISVKNRADIDAAKAYAGAADLLLFDAKTPPGALPGGMGLRFDWTLLRGQSIATPWGLSGGLSADTICEAIRLTGAPLVDVSSGIEDAPGIKSVDKIMAFCKAVSAC
ncbi:phosphoribosylanthranilate isomerase [Sphingobium sp. CCH11-B1]|jgi:phosphoribosylanthranilate isomerase|uniref:phosphoribosylanthranilate isomerase n=1 Tax=Sphingobium sp. CCH11-B1 TaxID=1768781 RepID=UPI00083613B4|nr:phosphoribosylanthranilate isomerase [Sphingobium sp. CCH11-B1]MEA3389114.1 phosphoribosylanthranilate isomerase [Pseudomonadota bacterium]